MYCTCSLELSRSDRVGIVRSRLRDPHISVCCVFYEYARYFRDILFPKAKILLSPLLPSFLHVGLQHSTTGEEKRDESARRAALVSPLLFTGFHGKPVGDDLRHLFHSLLRIGDVISCSEDLASCHCRDRVNSKVDVGDDAIESSGSGNTEMSAICRITGGN